MFGPTGKRLTHYSHGHSTGRQNKHWRIQTLLLGICLLGACLSSASAQSEQKVIVTIKDYSFRTTQMPLQLHIPTVIHITNLDDVRHDFGSDIFQDGYAQVESGGAISYGQGIGGVYLDPDREAAIRFTINRPGRYKFRCSIHPDMEGEILLMSAGEA